MMNLTKAQNWITIIFIFLMVLNILMCYSVFQTSDIFLVYLQTYGVHLSIILAYYFVQENKGTKQVTKFKFGLLLTLILMWNGLILGIMLDTEFKVDVLTKKLGEFPQYASFLIAAGIVWLFNSKDEAEDNGNEQTEDNSSEETEG